MTYREAFRDLCSVVLCDLVDRTIGAKVVRSPRKGDAWAGKGGRRNVDLFKSLAVGLTRVEPRKHTRFSLFSRGRATSRGEARRRDAAR